MGPKLQFLVKLLTPKRFGSEPRFIKENETRRDIVQRFHQNDGDGLVASASILKISV